MANEKRLIDADAEIEAIKKYACEDCESYNEIKCRSCWADDLIGWIEDAPKVDAVEVVHAQWLYDSGSGKHFCSACDEYALSFKKDTLYGGDLYEVCLTDYCPNCGADMR